MPEPRRFNVIETFGPTIQGEGPHAGRVVGFVRFGGCDFRCSWCDSMYAVDPAQVRANSEKLTADEIVDRLLACDVVVLSGDNPALVQGEQLAEALALAGKEFHVETQGTVWHDWLGEAAQLVVSPKPPSSGEHRKSEVAAPRFFEQVNRHMGWLGDTALKIVVADRTDLDWALLLRDEVDPDRVMDFYLSALTPPAATLEQVAGSYRNLCDLVLDSPLAVAHDPVVLPQLHVIAWGHERGV